jgi:hypothetical protein
VTIGKLTFVIGDDGKVVNNPPRSDGPVCWKCGKPGHLSWKYLNQGGGSGQGGGHGGGRGGGRAGRDGKSNIKRIPLQPGESHKRTVNGITMYWCGTCTYWNLTHLTANHANSKAANLAEGEMDNDTWTVKETNANRVTFYSAVTKRMTSAGK